MPSDHQFPEFVFPANPGPGHRVGIDPTCGGTFDARSGACDRCAAIDPSRAGLAHDWPTPGATAREDVTT